MGICEYIRNLLLECPLLSGQVISIEFFDEKLGGVGIFEEYEKNIIREYTDGERLIRQNVKIMFSHSGGIGNTSEENQRTFAQNICNYLNNAEIYGGFDDAVVVGIECECQGISKEAGMQKRELICRVRFLERKGDV